MKICRICKKEFPHTNEYFSYNNDTELSMQCKHCRNKLQRQLYSRKQQKINSDSEIIKRKRLGIGIINKPKSLKCEKCKVTFPFTREYFPPDNRHNFKLRLECRNCYNTRYRKTNKEYRNRIRLEILTYYSKGVPNCSCCQEQRMEFLSIDHINGGGAQHRKTMKASSIYSAIKRDNFPENYRVLCHNCNMSKGLYGYCPHEKEII
jgi:superfamily II DNA helicase RecQ